jgi:uncharacterized membrane protein (UPF0127 family)
MTWRRLLRPLLLAAGAVLAAAALAQTVQRLPTIKLNAGIHVITAEVAADDASRARGLMFRERLGPNEGMLFLFDPAAKQCMWMRNTLIPLSVAFIADDGRIVNIADMKPHDETSHCSQQPVRYALEMERGWFSKRGLGAGAKIGGLPPIRP